MLRHVRRRPVAEPHVGARFEGLELAHVEIVEFGEVLGRGRARSDRNVEHDRVRRLPVADVHVAVVASGASSERDGRERQKRDVLFVTGISIHSGPRSVTSRQNASRLRHGPQATWYPLNTSICTQIDRSRIEPTLTCVSGECRGSETLPARKPADIVARSFEKTASEWAKLWSPGCSCVPEARRRARGSPRCAIRAGRPARAGEAHARPHRGRAAVRRGSRRQMEAESPRRRRGAADIAMDNPAFYSVTLKNLVTPWTNREQTVFAPLNDYTATVIGMVRDDLPFNEVLSADILYVGNAGLGLPAVSATNNDHYARMETRGVNLLTGLQRTTQSGVYGTRPRRLPGHDLARCGAVVLHRRHQPRDVPLHAAQPHVPRPRGVQDTSRPPDRIRQDVSRNPGGDARVPQQLRRLPLGHGPDGAGVRVLHLRRGAGSPRLHRRRRAAEVLQRHHVRVRLPHAGRRLGEPLAQGPERAARLGAELPGSGNGAKSLGEEFGGDAFATCQVEKVFRAVCLRARRTRRTAARSHRWRARSAPAATG